MCFFFLGYQADIFVVFDIKSIRFIGGLLTRITYTNSFCLDNLKICNI